MSQHREGLTNSGKKEERQFNQILNKAFKWWGTQRLQFWTQTLQIRDTKFARAARRMAVPVSARCQGGRRYITVGPGRFVGVREGVGQLARLNPIQEPTPPNSLPPKEDTS